MPINWYFDWLQNRINLLIIDCILGHLVQHMASRRKWSHPTPHIFHASKWRTVTWRSTWTFQKNSTDVSNPNALLDSIASKAHQLSVGRRNTSNFSTKFSCRTWRIVISMGSDIVTSNPVRQPWSIKSGEIRKYFSCFRKVQTKVIQWPTALVEQASMHSLIHRTPWFRQRRWRRRSHHLQFSRRSTCWRHRQEPGESVTWIGRQGGAINPLAHVCLTGFRWGGSMEVHCEHHDCGPVPPASRARPGAPVHMRWGPEDTPMDPPSPKSSQAYMGQPF